MTGDEGALAPELDGRHDFDFLLGSWRIANRRLENPVDERSTEWREFPSSMECRPILAGLGNFDLYSAPDFPGRPGFEALALRLFDPAARLWRIWWASTVGAGQLDTPVVGRFEDGVGRFECDDVIAGLPVKVRFDWTEITASSARWQQSFSFDGESYRLNWVMQFSRSS
jgi:hypothetical protein